jgi:N-acetylmuramoyl-L-alanine amidase
MSLLISGCAMIGALAAPAEGAGQASPATAPVAHSVTVLAVRSWSAPTNTRVVFEFSAPVTTAGPDSGDSPSLAIALPGERLSLGLGVQGTLVVRDTALDSVRIDLSGDVPQLKFAFADTVRFHVFTLDPEIDKPYRLVVDVTRPSALAAEGTRLDAIAATKKARRTRLVAVDAGHGGEDSGAHGPNGLLEKNVTLAVARALVEELNRIPGVQGVLIRRDDYFIPLHERYHIAERMKADMFVSIHCNSSRRRGSGSGTEVYFLSLNGASDQADADLADTENAADLVGGVPSQTDDALVNILYDVKRSAAMEKSQLLAESLLDHLATDRRLELRGVKQAGFAVLKSGEFPSVLVETAFINNPIEARMLRSAEFQRQISRQVAAGVSTYFERSGVDLSPATPAASSNH